VRNIAELVRGVGALKLNAIAAIIVECAVVAAH
jgi:hypothetical protein